MSEARHIAKVYFVLLGVFGMAIVVALLEIVRRLDRIAAAIEALR